MHDSLALIPQPVEVHQTEGCFRLNPKSPLYASTGVTKMREIAGTFNEMLKQVIGFELSPSFGDAGEDGDHGIRLVLMEHIADGCEEAYHLSVGDAGVSIEAKGYSGLFYGLQSLLQLLPADISSKDDICVPGVEIIDRPRYAWRGMHLDVSRHFYPPESIKKFIGLLARHKMNVFHLHLTDDQGWRLEIKRYPRLTEVGAWRKEADEGRYGGFYTQDEIRDIVEYARRRFVTIVPEIEMPGHARAALAAYPSLSCTGGPFEVANTWGIFDDVYCAGSEETFRFLEDVLAEVTELFPGCFVHIGGDECPKDRWRHHDLCQNRIRRESLRNEDELQAYFIARIGRFLTGRGRRLIGWDEILEGGAPDGAAVMAWRGMEKGIAAARAGCDVVMTPTSHCYFDYYQGKEGEPKAIGGYLPLETVYAFEPTPEGLTAAEAHHILGGQGNIWTEYMPDWRHVEYMAFPRTCALAEVLWSPRETRLWPAFRDRLQYHLRRLDALGVNYRRL